MKRQSAYRENGAHFTVDAIVIGAGSGLSVAAGLTYSGERFWKYFSDFAAFDCKVRPGNAGKG